MRRSRARVGLIASGAALLTCACGPGIAGPNAARTSAPAPTSTPTIVTLAAPPEEPTPPPSTASSAPPAEPPPEPDPLLSSASQRIPWEGGAQIAGHIEGDHWPPSLAIGVIRSGHITSKIEGVEEVMGALPASAPPICESFELYLRAEPWGEARGLRVSVLCSVGEDSLTRTEIVALYEVRDDRLRRVYSGLGDRLDSTMNSCVTKREVTFSVAGGKLEARIETATTWHDQPLDPAFTAELRRQCHVGKSKQVEKLRSLF